MKNKGLEIKKDSAYINESGAPEKLLKTNITQNQKKYNNGDSETLAQLKEKLSANGQVALKYLKEGKAVIPLWKSDKKPLLSLKTWHCTWQEYKEKLPTEEEVIEWWTRWPDANIGIVTGEISGIIVLDIDGPEGEAYLEENGFEIPTTPYVKTGKGRHIYFKHPKDGKVYKNFSRGKFKVDCRGDGGYVVAPPSLHPDGEVYDWKESIFDIPLADAPPWFLNMIVTKERKTTSSNSHGMKGDYPISNFDAVVNGCAFMKHCVENAETLSETEWHSALSIAIFCENGEEKAHEISEPYIGYSYEETQRKIEHLRNFGPKLCSTIREQHGEQYCVGCKWADMDTSPVRIGWRDPVQEAKKIVENGIKKALETGDIAACLEEEVLKALVILEEQNVADFERLKERIKKETKTPIRTLNKGLLTTKKIIQSGTAEPEDNFELPRLGDMLDACPNEFAHFHVPSGFIVNQNGIRGRNYESISNRPFFISSKFKEINSENIKLELSFWYDNQWKTVIMERDEALNNKKTERFSKFGFPVNSNNSKEIVSYIEEFESVNDRIQVFPEKRTTAAIGWFENQFVCKQGVLSKSGFINHTDIVFHSPYGTMIDFELKSNPDWRSLASQILPLLLRINELNIVLPIIGWFLVSAIAPLVREKFNSQFPLLNCWGTRGAGKSTLVEILWRMMGVRSELLAISTPFVMTKALSETNAVPIIFDEYKPNELQEAKLNALNQKLKLAYRADADQRGKADRTVEYFKLTAPVCVVGEDHFTDSALRERSSVIAFRRNWIEKNERTVKKYLDELVELPLEEFAEGYYLYLLNHYLNDEKKLKEDMEQAKKIISLVPDIPFRNKANSQIIIVGIQIFNRLLRELDIDINFEPEDILFPIEYSLQHVMANNETLMDKVMKFVMDIGLRELGREIMFEPDKGKLYITKTKLLEFIERHRQNTRTDLPTKTQLKNELEELEKDQRSYILSGTGIQKEFHYPDGLKLNGRRIVIDVKKLEVATEIDPDTWEEFHYAKLRKESFNF